MSEPRIRHGIKINEDNEKDFGKIYEETYEVNETI